jgi:hypothetical protein
VDRFATEAASTPAGCANDQFFNGYKDQGGTAELVLMGARLMPLPAVPWVRYAGMLSESDRLRALEAATIVVVPSPLESLSLLALEAMAVGTPVLCNARADVLVDHCWRSVPVCSMRTATSSSVHGLLLADRSLRADGLQRKRVRRTTLSLGCHHGEPTG